MKYWIAIILLLSLTSVASANPVIIPDPVNIVAYTIVLASAMMVEASIVTLIVMFWGIELKPFYIALILGNLAIYLVIFLPLLGLALSLWIAEAVIVVFDALLIKVITLRDTFQGDAFRPLRYGYALIIATIGNVVSYYVGAVMNA